LACALSLMIFLTAASTFAESFTPVLADYR
jgi:hypothetical protein